MALLLFAVVVPAVCLVWFMNAAMQNERLAARQKLAELYRAQLSSVQVQLERHWDATLAELEGFARTTQPAAAFAKCVRSGLVDSVRLFDEHGRTIYPNASSAVNAGEPSPKWADASQLEDVRRNFTGAARLYRALAQEATNHHLAARALQAEARCLLRAGRKEDVLRLVRENLGQERFHEAADAQGRLIAANMELMALELGPDNLISQRLKDRLDNYENPSLAAPQRRFLMKELQRLYPGVKFPTLAAEELAAQDPPTNAWQFATQDRRVGALVRFDTLVRMVPDSTVALLSPGTDHSAAFVSVPAGPRMTGWQLVRRFDASIERPTQIYLWTGIFVLGIVSVLTLLALRVLRRQAALARLKNDLVATVSHELKTPLASMRVLVDTLLDTEQLDEARTREYLQLIARENERLSRLIQNFLTFSRLERDKQTFHFAPSLVRPIIDAAVQAVPTCQLELQMEANLPPMMADPDAVSTALINLLDNACKYSEDKHVILRAAAQNGHVLLSVQDHGIGITARDTKKVFAPFYQVDERLSRAEGGCGLGLSIVQSIVRAHRGRVSVQSQPGRGSTFTIAIPAAKEQVNA